MKKRVLCLLLALLLALPALADGSTAGIYTGETPSAIVTIESGDNYTLSTTTGATTLSGSVEVGLDGTAVSEIPTVTPASGYEQTGWGIVTQSGTVTKIDLNSYTLSEGDILVPIVEEIVPVTPTDNQKSDQKTTDDAKEDTSKDTSKETEKDTSKETDQEIDTDPDNSAQKASQPSAVSDPASSVDTSAASQTAAVPALVPAAGNLALITEDHFAYVNGFPDGGFHPTEGLTRAQVCAIFYRLLQDKTLPAGAAASFSDLSTSHWAYTEISVMAARGIVNGYPDGTFRPEGQITRAELLKMAACFFELTAASSGYSDAATHWAQPYIAFAELHGWIAPGTPGALLQPDEVITRAETVSIVNAMLSRSADELYVTAAGSPYTDVIPNVTPHSYDILEASLAHTYEQTPTGELWLSLQ